MKAAIYSPNGTLTNREGSHRTAWAYMRGDQLAREEGWDVDIIYTKDEATTDWQSYDVVLVYMGMEWAGALNLFGGASDENLEKFRRILDLGDKIQWLDEAPIGLGDLVLKRWPNFDGEALNARAQLAPVARQKQKEYQIIGDSHSLNWYLPGASVSRNDGKTLHGALKDRLSTYIAGNPSKIAVCFGNIDIRHHLCRFQNPVKEVLALVDELEYQLKGMKERLACEIEVVQPLPIENATRRLPKTGWYKGTPFFGTWEERNTVRKAMDLAMRVACVANGWTYLEYPDYFTNELGELKFDVMEVPGSVHISWEHGRMNRMLRGAK